MEIITGRTGKAHVTSQQDREINQAVFGSESVVLNIGSCFEAEKQSDNKIRIKDGLLMLQGTGASIKNGEYEDVTIENGSQGYGRVDFICAKYEKTVPEGIESVVLEVIKGRASYPISIPKVPSGNIRNGDTIVYFPLYKVTLEGVTIESIEPVFKFANEQKVLWRGEAQMHEAQQIQLSEPVGRQKNGIVLVWSPNDTVNIDENIHCQFILKDAVRLFPDTTHSFQLSNTGFTKMACKSVYVYDDVIKGNSYNVSQGTSSGIAFNNQQYSLRYVLGY